MRHAHHPMAAATRGG
ncbi:hypothetical protein YPPY13_3662, partial [Yersinia pestis PY-13]